MTTQQADIYEMLSCMRWELVQVKLEDICLVDTSTPCSEINLKYVHYI